MYQIKDSKTGNLSSKLYPSLKAASRAADRKDNAYGAVRYVAVPVKEQTPMREAVKHIFELS